MNITLIGKEDIVLITTKEGVVALTYDAEKNCLQEVPICDKAGDPIASIGVINEPPR